MGPETRVNLLKLNELGLPPHVVDQLREFLQPATEGDGGDVYLSPSAAARHWGSLAGFQAALEARFGVLAFFDTGTFASSVPAKDGEDPGPALIICNTCLCENLIEPNDPNYAFCAKCGDALLGSMDYSSSPFTRHDDAAVAFLKITGFEALDAVDSIKVLEEFGKGIKAITWVAFGHVKLMGDQALLIFQPMPPAQTVGVLGAAGSKTNLLQTALGILNDIHHFATQFSATRGISLQVSASLHMGEMISGVLGIKGEKGIDVLGATVNLAARLLPLATSDLPVTITKDLAALIDPATIPKPISMGLHDLKGFGAQTVFGLQFGSSTMAGVSLDENGHGMEGESECARHAKVGTKYCPYCGNPALAQPKQEDVAQRRDVYVLSIDMVGFSTQSAGMGAPAILDWVNDFYRIAEPIVARYHGVITDRRGDELVVRFGVPSVGVNSVNAVLTGVELKKAFEHWNHTSGRTPIQFRVGVAYGEALVKGTTTVGEVVDRAVKLQSLAPVNGILIDAQTADHVGNLFEFAAGDHGALVTAANYRALDSSRRRTMELPAFGHGHQLALLETAFAQLADDGLRTGFLFGTEGSGRDTLVNHFIRARGFGAHVLRGSATTWQSDALRAALRDNREHFAARLALDPEIFSASPITKALIERALPAGFADFSDLAFALVSRYLGVASHNHSVALGRLRESPKQLLEWTSIAIAAYLAQLATTKSVVLELHNLEIADVESMEFLKTVLERITDKPIFVLATATADLQQDEALHQLVKGLPGYEALIVKPLNKDDSAQLLAYVLDSFRNRDQEGTLAAPNPPPVPDDLVTDFHRMSGGNPLYLTELARTYLDHGWIVWNDAWVYQPPAHDSIPRTLDDALTNRLDRLQDSPQELMLFEALSVMAESSGVFWIEPFVDVRELFGITGEIDFHKMIGRLEERGLIASHISNSETGRHEYTMTPRRLGELAYRRLLDDDRKALHARIAHWLIEHEIKFSERHDIYAMTAFHAEHAGYPRDAYFLYREAMEKAEHIPANSDILRYFGEARRLIDVVDMPNQSSEKLYLLGKAVQVYQRQVRKPEWHALLCEMEGMVASEPAGSPDALVEVIVNRIDYMAITGDIDEKWLASHQETIENGQGNFSEDKLGRYYYAMGRKHSSKNAYDLALQFFDKAADLAKRSSDRQIMGLVFLGRATVYARKREHVKAIADATEAAATFKDTGQRLEYCYAMITRASSAIEMHDFALATTLLDTALAVASEIGSIVAEGYIYANQGYSAALQGQFAQAITLTDKVITLVGQHDIKLLKAIVVINKAVFVAPEKPDEAIALAWQAIDLHVSDSYDAAAWLGIALAQYRKNKLELCLRALKNVVDYRQAMEHPFLEHYEVEFLQFVFYLSRDDQLGLARVEDGLKIKLTDLGKIPYETSAILAPFLTSSDLSGPGLPVSHQRRRRGRDRSAGGVWAPVDVAEETKGATAGKGPSKPVALSRAMISGGVQMLGVEPIVTEQVLFDGAAALSIQPEPVVDDPPQLELLQGGKADADTPGEEVGDDGLASGTLVTDNALHPLGALPVVARARFLKVVR